MLDIVDVLFKDTSLNPVNNILIIDIEEQMEHVDTLLFTTKELSMMENSTKHNRQSKPLLKVLQNQEDCRIPLTNTLKIPDDVLVRPDRG